MSAKVHPKAWGFQRGLIVSVSVTGVMTLDFVAEDARTTTDVVYIAIRDDDQIIKVGQTGRSLLGRWSGALRAIGEGKPLRRVTEQLARAAWQRLVRGRQFEVWFKPAAKIRIDYIPGTVLEVSQRVPEEVYLDAYYHPLIGRRLEGRTTSIALEPGEAPP